MQITVNKITGVDKIFAANHRRGSDFKTSIQNLTGGALALTYTNDAIQTTSPLTFGTLAGQPTTVANGATECINCPMTGIKMIGTSTGIVNIVEAG